MLHRQRHIRVMTEHTYLSFTLHKVDLQYGAKGFSSLKKTSLPKPFWNYSSFNLRMLGDVNRKVNVAMGAVNPLQAKTFNLNFGLYLLTFWQTFSKKSIFVYLVVVNYYCCISSIKNKTLSSGVCRVIWSVFYRFLSRFIDFYLPWTSDDDILSRV